MTDTPWFPKTVPNAIWERYVRAAHLLDMRVSDLWITMGGDSHAEENWKVLEALITRVLGRAFEDKPALTPRQMAWARQKCKRKETTYEQ